MTMADDLGPVREALLHRARADADQILADARAVARRRTDEARQAAADILDRARQAGRLDASAELDTARGQARDQARDTVLAAQREVYDELVAQVAAVIAAKVAQDATRTALRRVIEEQLGADAVLTDLPDGGVGGAVPGRRLVLTPARLADGGLSRCAARIEELWAS